MKGGIFYTFSARPQNLSKKYVKLNRESEF